MQPLRPAKRAAFYIPIPNRIVCSPGNKRKIIIARRRSGFRQKTRDFVFIGDLRQMRSDEPIDRRRWRRRFCSLFPFFQAHASTQTKMRF